MFEILGLNGALHGLSGLLILLMGGWCKMQEDRLAKLEKFNEAVHKHWEEDAKTYLSKMEFSDFAKDIKTCLNRIEDKIEKLR